MAFEDEVQESQAGPYMQHLGLVVQEVEVGRAVLRLPFDPGLETFRREGVLHGGAIASLIDAAAGMALRTMRRPDEAPWRSTSTSDLNVSYLNAGRTDLTAEARVLRMGRNLCFFQIDVRDTEDTLVAVGRATMAIRRE